MKKMQLLLSDFGAISEISEKKTIKKKEIHFNIGIRLEIPRLAKNKCNNASGAELMMIHHHHVPLYTFLRR